jgi:hypothetical protein
MLRSIAYALAATALTAATAAAQCLGPDGMAGPCCSVVAPTLPAFPAITLPGDAICWDSCNVGAQICTQIVLGAPVQVNCTEYTVAFQSQDCSGNPQLKSLLNLTYTRTWTEFPVPGTVGNQVWRFVVKADVSPSTTAFGCQVPNCLGAHPTAFYHGYLDYAFDCVAGTWESALVLFHGCDKFQHDPLFSSRPGVFHPGRSFALVAPSTPGNPFAPVSLTPTGGPTFFEAMRDTPDPATLACEAAETLAQGKIINLAKACACPFAFFPPQVTARHIDGTSTCGSNFRSLSAFPTLPWFELMTTSLGTWTTSASYPGTEAVWVDEGTFLHVEACTLSGAAELYAEIKVGATTEGGFLAAVGPVGADRFTDLVDNYSVQLGTPILPPFFGSVRPTNHIVYVNPF